MVTVEWICSKPSERRYPGLATFTEEIGTQSADILSREIVVIRQHPHKTTRYNGATVPYQNHITANWTRNPHIAKTGFQGHVFIDDANTRMLTKEEVEETPQDNPQVWSL
ncbi:hypothetical protein OCU04_001063 [Sclerotinia nivalis]|uniref:Uncharacterized protein n=1 Tax=Sclerotinia nivalis TaxID=352851 RepID=A0A9X0AXD4_9HELO|nr:hypothetical protein OCU04_001063 [Sclerotinia nivalis]